MSIIEKHPVISCGVVFSVRIIFAVMFSNEWLSLLIAGEILENDETATARREADRWWWYDQNHFEDNESSSPKDTTIT